MQAPLNVLDQSFMQTGGLERLKGFGIEIHVRSVFLQGILLQHNLPPSLADLAKGFNLFVGICRERGLNPMTACMAYIRQSGLVDQLVVGVTSLFQLNEVIKAWRLADQIEWVDFSGCNLAPNELLNPANWPRRDILLS